MEYQTQKWKIIDLIKLYKDGLLILDPPYQRNFIWSKKDQSELIDSILKKRFPLPTFFLRKIDNNLFEMVDGQQRTRSILSYYKRKLEGEIIGELLEKEKKEFENFQLAITVITSIEKDESIEDFYARVNKTGRKLNKPELNKAEYFYTEFLALNEELSENPDFKALDLFTELSVKRMNDIDFVSELVAQLEFGIFEKKDKVDTLYESDISEEKKDKLRDKFLTTIRRILPLNDLYPIKKTRYRQRNDFFTLFGFVHKYQDLAHNTLEYFYRVLVLVQDEISPSNDFCLPFKEYAINCVSQSNQKRARERRLVFFENLLLNNLEQPNETQKMILEFYELPIDEGLQKIGNYYTLSVDKLSELKISLKFND